MANKLLSRNRGKKNTLSKRLIYDTLRKRVVFYVEEICLSPHYFKFHKHFSFSVCRLTAIMFVIHTSLIKLLATNKIQGKDEKKFVFWKINRFNDYLFYIS